MKRKKSSAGFAESVGFFVRSPLAALEQARNQPNLSHAALALGLALLSCALAGAMRQGGPMALAGVSGVLAAGYVLWLLMSGLWHLMSRWTGHPGGFHAFLCSIGWSAVLLWPSALLALLTSRLPPVSPLVQLLSVALSVGFVYLVWRNFKDNYGWSGGKALGLMVVPLALVSGLLAAAAVLLTVSLVGGAVLSRLF